MTRLRLVKPTRTAFAYENRMGVTYYLHEGRTTTGKPRYFFAKTMGPGMLSEMPGGVEVSESINGVVSVRRKTTDRAAVPEEDVKVVQEAVGRHLHLKGYMVRAVDSAVVIFEPHPRPSELRAFAERYGTSYRASNFIEERMKKAQYAPIMKFERESDGYVVLRMTYRGKGGWSWPLGAGKLGGLAKKFVPSIGELSKDGARLPPPNGPCARHRQRLDRGRLSFGGLGGRVRIPVNVPTPFRSTGAPCPLRRPPTLRRGRHSRRPPVSASSP